MNTVLVALNSKFIHSSLAVWCLKASLGANAVVFEGTINDDKERLFSSLYEKNADIYVFSCYIWNIELVKFLAAKLKTANPYIKIIFGGPEITATSAIELDKFADFFIIGAGEHAITQVVSGIENNLPLDKIQIGRSMPLSSLPSPYTDKYFNSFKGGEKELKSKLIYYESSRGCPYNCSYCLSGEDRRVDNLPAETVIADMQKFSARGIKTVKFVDRTFNSDKEKTKKIFDFLKDFETDTTFHFEVSADIFNTETLDIIAKIPLKRVQFEVGVQSTNPETLVAVQRYQNVDKILKNSKTIIEKGNAQVHIDLIAGLPYEDLESFKKSFNDVIKIRPHKLQLGFLKLLKGSKIRTQTEEFGYKFQSLPPYEVTENNFISSTDLEELKFVESSLNLYYNRSMFTESIEFLLSEIYNDNGYQLFFDLSTFSTTFDFKKNGLCGHYSLIYEFLKLRTDEKTASHLIFIDSFCHQPNPEFKLDNFTVRDKQAEKFFLANYKNLSKLQTAPKRIRIEKHIETNERYVFFYDHRTTVKDRFTYIVLPQTAFAQEKI